MRRAPPPVRGHDEPQEAAGWRYRTPGVRRNRKRSGGSLSRRSTGEVKGLRAEALALKELVADLSLENLFVRKLIPRINFCSSSSQKNMGGEATNAIGPREWPKRGRPRMRYPAANRSPKGWKIALHGCPSSNDLEQAA